MTESKRIITEQKKKKKLKNNDCCFRSRIFRGFWVAGAVCVSHTPMPDLLWPVFKCFISLSGLSFLLLVIWSRSKWWYLWPAESFLKNNRINIKVKYTSKNNTLSTTPAFTLHTDRIQHHCSRDLASGGKNGLKWADSQRLLLAYWEASAINHPHVTVKSLLGKDLYHSI